MRGERSIREQGEMRGGRSAQGGEKRGKIFEEAGVELKERKEL